VVAIDFDAAALGRIRMAMSPAFEAVSWLAATTTGWVHPVLGDLGVEGRYALRYPDVRMLAHLVSGYPMYMPDFLTPKPIVGRPAEILRDQIDAVAEAPLEIVLENLDYAAKAGVHLPPQIRHAAEDGSLPRIAASGLSQFWRSVMAPRWPELRHVLERDLAHRGRMLADSGMALVLRTLHTRLQWDGATLQIGLPIEEEPWAHHDELVLAPSVLAWPHLFAQVAEPTNAVVLFPAAGIATALDRPPTAGAEGGRGPTRVHALDELLGESRAAVLLDLDMPRTTAQLSTRRQLAPATVSYHLGALVNAGLVLRRREGRRVLYGRSAYGDLLLEAVFGNAG
jgi:DNA-binding transcriptional ArsR family regulator